MYICPDRQHHQGSVTATQVLGSYDAERIINRGPSFNLTNFYDVNLVPSNITVTNTFDRNSCLSPSPIPVILISSVAEMYMHSVIVERLCRLLRLYQISQTQTQERLILMGPYKSVTMTSPFIAFALADLFDPTCSVDIVPG